MAGTAEKPTFVYVTYIQSSPEKVWQALTDADLTAQYWGHSNVSDWQPGSRWEHRRTDGSGIADVVGEVIEAAPPRRLVMTFGGAGRLGSAVRRAVRYRTAQRHRPADGDPRRPSQRVGLRGRLSGLGSGHLEPEVAAGNRTRVTAGALGDARGAARRTDVALARVIWRHAASDHVPRRRLRARGGTQDRTGLPRGVREGLVGQAGVLRAEDLRHVRRQREGRLPRASTSSTRTRSSSRSTSPIARRSHRTTGSSTPPTWARRAGSGWTSRRPGRSIGTRCASSSTRRSEWSRPRS